MFFRYLQGDADLTALKSWVGCRSQGLVFWPPWFNLIGILLCFAPDLLLTLKEDILTKCSAPTLVGSSTRATIVGLSMVDLAAVEMALDEGVVYLQLNFEFFLHKIRAICTGIILFCRELWEIVTGKKIFHSSFKYTYLFQLGSVGTHHLF